MRAKAGDPPRTMPQKILVGRTDDSRLEGDIVRVRVDQVILAREPNAILREASDWGLKKVAVETAVAYDTRCVTSGEDEELACNSPAGFARICQRRHRDRAGRYRLSLCRAPGALCGAGAAGHHGRSAARRDGRSRHAHAARFTLPDRRCAARW